MWGDERSNVGVCMLRTGPRTFLIANDMSPLNIQWRLHTYVQKGAGKEMRRRDPSMTSPSLTLRVIRREPQCNESSPHLSERKQTEVIRLITFPRSDQKGAGRYGEAGRSEG